MKYMVLGFAIDRVNNQVLLIRKNRPDWQAGKLNGVGGHMEPEDGCLSCVAMAREFREETGFAVDAELWRICGTIFSVGKSRLDPGWHVAVYVIEMGTWPELVQQTDEEVMWVDIADLDALAASGACLDNIPILVRLCLMRESKPSNRIPRFSLEY